MVTSKAHLFYREIAINFPANLTLVFLGTSFLINLILTDFATFIKVKGKNSLCIDLNNKETNQTSMSSLMCNRIRQRNLRYLCILKRKSAKKDR